MTAEQVVGLLIIGVTLGAVYTIMAMGLTFVYGVTKIFNMAHSNENKSKVGIIPILIYLNKLAPSTAIIVVRLLL